MGVNAYDPWTILHFVYGILSTMAICPETPGVGVLIANIIHAYMERIE